MKTCSKNRKLIVWLAVDVLDAQAERNLQAHLATCEPCRRYSEEIEAVMERLAVSNNMPDIQASEAFHERLAARLGAERSRSLWEALCARLRATRLNWRVALALLGATALIVATVSNFVLRSGAPLRSPTSPGMLASTIQKDLEPTIANYQLVADQSLERFDELLNRQGSRNPSPGQVYTASVLAATKGAN